MRLRPALVAAASNDAKWRTTPGMASEATLRLTWCPNWAVSTLAAAALTALCAPGYDGSGAVLASAFHVGSAVTPGLPGVPARIAVIGRQNWKWYLPSYMAIAVSATVRFSSAATLEAS